MHFGKENKKWYSFTLWFIKPSGMVVAFKVLKTGTTRKSGHEKEEEEEGLLAVQNLIFPSSSPSSFRRSRKPPGPIKKEAPSPPGGERGGKGRRQNPVPKSIYGRKFSFLPPFLRARFGQKEGSTKVLLPPFSPLFPLLSSAATPPPHFFCHIFFGRWYWGTRAFCLWGD